ncbi:hypothetical protein M409DRAFT_67522 [Zasmidium cellare ATCC 36951]|uniref:Uncharacterized protein n=1 Tax=Zasmidium cellare ATCC 36951 TaxID=1080233 RepID=A0A6A6CCK3_ZASCE|nr:uncharacterized protein M409DRAFT_67522 [Zasmidium cellare ATCC 36951]KAF2164771.1 hypothetical protein M409DRAFT_67522 [Zasmidium cellare ATCC 36951]
MAAEQTSPLLTLPAELRNRIWHELFAPPTREIFHLTNGHMEPALLSVNHQLRTECAGIFYANTTLHFTDPQICIRRLTSLSPKNVELIPEMRFDTSETCVKATSWRTAFRELPGLDEDTKLESLRDELAKRGMRLGVGILRARLVVGCTPSWTSDPLAAALDAVKSGFMVGRMMFI